jgi:outer membrane protein assembly factor BamB
MRAIRADATGDLTPNETGAMKPGVAWNQERRGNYMQTPIIVGDLLFGCADTGLVTCFNGKTGEVSYSERLSRSSEGYTASPVSDGRHLYFTSELGNVFVVPTSDKFSVVATNSLGETSLSTPAISDGTIFFRTRDKIVAIGKKPVAP